MKTVLITGARGFIGKNLRLRLSERPDLQLLCHDKDDSEELLVRGLQSAEVVFHLAGVNRPKDVSEFEEGNHLFTERILDELVKTGKRPLIIATSSVQASKRNPYGVSKKRAEDALLKFKRRTGASVAIFRLTNVFGKWCRPFYNSVVATFCYQVSRGENLTVDDPRKFMEFVYIDDVISSFVQILDGQREFQDEFLCVSPSYSSSLEELADIINSFKDLRDTARIPNMDKPIVKNLYATYLSYLDVAELSYSPDKRSDDRGYLFEFVKSAGFGQIFVSRTVPGVTRGNHYHNTKVEKFCVVDGNARICLRHMMTQERIDFVVDGRECRIVDIPPGYTHSISNIGEKDLLTLFWANEPFDASRSDTFTCEV
jgi:UDP-2-acetamido-2,6-beta-L-arabino-hexul-4-ose reductase